MGNSQRKQQRQQQERGRVKQVKHKQGRNVDDENTNIQVKRLGEGGPAQMDQLDVDVIMGNGGKMEEMSMEPMNESPGPAFDVTSPDGYLVDFNSEEPIGLFLRPGTGDDAGKWFVDGFKHDSAARNTSLVDVGDALIAVNGKSCFKKSKSQVDKLLEQTPCTVEFSRSSNQEKEPPVTVAAGTTSTNTTTNETTGDRDATEENAGNGKGTGERDDNNNQSKSQNDNNNPALKGGNSSAADDDEVEYIDFLDTTKPLIPRELERDKIYIQRNEMPPVPSGGWKWRPAQVIARNVIDEELGQVDKIQFLDDRADIILTDLQVAKSNGWIAEFESKSSLTYMHEYQVGDFIDVEDIFESSKTGKITRKWRVAEVIARHKYFIRIHYNGWSRYFDEWIHVMQQADRLAEFCQMTDLAIKQEQERDKKFKVHMEKDNGLTVVDVDPDGACLFRSVSHQIYGTVKHHQKVRNATCDYLLANRDRFEFLVPQGRFEEYVEGMRSSKEWGDDAEIRAIEELYDRPIEIYRALDDGRPEKLKLHLSGDLPDDDLLRGVDPIRLSYHGNNHYNSVIPMNLKLDKDGNFKPPPLRTQSLIRNHRKLHQLDNKTAFRLSLNLEAKNQS